MFLEILIAIVIGILAGIITGLTPGIHINLVSLLVFSISSILLNYTTTLLIAVFIISMAVTHTFLDFIPSCFLGAPEGETALSVLPAHRLLLKGRGYEAVALTVMGSLASLIIVLALTPLIIPLVKITYPLIRSSIGYILIVTSVFLILKERNSKIWALVVFLMAGTLGLAVLNTPLFKEPLFPLFSGLFGTSMLLISYLNKVKIPKQKTTFPKINKKTGYKAVGATLVAGGITSFLPGVGPAQAAIIGSQLVKNLGTRGFLILVGGLNTVNMVLSFVALYTIDKARNGAIVVVSKILETFTMDYLILFLGCALVVGGIATFLALNIAKVFSKVIMKVNYRALCLSIISIISVLVLTLSGIPGFFVLVVSTFTGMVPALKGIGRNHLMGSLLLPVILYFLL